MEAVVRPSRRREKSLERSRFDLGRFLNAEAPNTPVFLTAITVSELLHGVHRPEGARRKKRERFVEELIAETALPFDASAARKHAKLWIRLQKQGGIIGPHDMMIAASCLALKHQVATLNVREFEKVPDLSLTKVLPYQVTS